MATQNIKIVDEQTIEITLSTGKTYTVIEPRAKHLEGLLQDLLQHKHTEQVRMLIGRITTPKLTKIEYLNLSLSDCQLINVALNFFSAAPTMRAEMMVDLKELGYLGTSESEQPTLNDTSAAE